LLDILLCQVGIGVKDLLYPSPRCNQAHDRAHGNACPSNARFTTHHRWPPLYTRKFLHMRRNRNWTMPRNHMWPVRKVPDTAPWCPLIPSFTQGVRESQRSREGSRGLTERLFSV